MNTGDYRKRFYERYITTQWQHVEKLVPETSMISAKVFRRQITPFLPENKDAVILDIACGVGQLVKYLQATGYRNACGIDLGKEQLAEGRAMGVKNLEEANLFDYLEKNTGKFDIIIGTHIIEHMTKQEALDAVDLIYKALKPGGKALLATPNAAGFQLGIFFAACDFTHEIFFSSTSLAQLLRVGNFRDVKVVGLGPVPYDLRSTLRFIAWKMVASILHVLYMIQYGTGRSLWGMKPLFEGIILGVGEKTAK